MDTDDLSNEEKYELIRQAIEELAENNQTWTKTKWIAKRTPLTHTCVAYHIDEAVERGWVSIYKKRGSRGKVFRVEMDADGGQAQDTQSESENVRA